MRGTVTAMAVGIVAGMTLGMPVAHAASGWKLYHGIQTGELLVCKKSSGPAIERDVHRIGGKKYVVAHCTGKPWGRR